MVKIECYLILPLVFLKIRYLVGLVSYYPTFIIKLENSKRCGVICRQDWSIDQWSIQILSILLLELEFVRMRMTCELISYHIALLLQQCQVSCGVCFKSVATCFVLDDPRLHLLQSCFYKSVFQPWELVEGIVSQVGLDHFISPVINACIERYQKYFLTQWKCELAPLQDRLLYFTILIEFAKLITPDLPLSFRKLMGKPFKRELVPKLVHGPSIMVTSSAVNWHLRELLLEPLSECENAVKISPWGLERDVVTGGIACV